MNLLDAISEFKNAIREHGLQPPDVIEAGKIHRFAAAGKPPSNRSAWCRLFPDLLGGAFGDWSTGLKATWQARREGSTKDGRREFDRQIRETRAREKAERAELQLQAKQQARDMWERATPCTTNT